MIINKSKDSCSLIYFLKRKLVVTPIYLLAVLIVKKQAIIGSFEKRNRWLNSQYDLLLVHRHYVSHLKSFKRKRKYPQKVDTIHLLEIKSLQRIIHINKYSDNSKDKIDFFEKLW